MVITGKYAIKIVLKLAHCGTRIERKIEIYATNIANKIKCMKTRV
jgi:hypothetical protein